MKRLPFVIVLACLGGCQSPFPNEHPATYGAGVRATMASQVVAPKASAHQGEDGAAAAAAYANYQRSYVTPTPQSDSPSFGNK